LLQSSCHSVGSSITNFESRSLGNIVRSAPNRKCANDPSRECIFPGMF
jgi:hypothetical protein